MGYDNSVNEPISTENVFKDIRKRILKLELEPGQRVSENQICAEYGVSRSVIRNVFARLSQMKLIEVYPQRGTYVALFDLHYISELLLIRMAVEKEVLYQMFTKLTKEECDRYIALLEENLKEQEKFGSLSSYEKDFRRLDYDFHKILVDSVKLPGVLELLSDNMIHIARWRNFVVAFEHQVPKLIEEHKAVVEFLKAGNL
ncbi:MAG: hypothetical protein PWP24_1350, partial [Clostridiales bacterium]|nr:hypothetical protein [Clostridiales bacterium]